ncbi:MAG: DUF1194 domain-containing protein [Pseudomonadota bacterium]
MRSLLVVLMLLSVPVAAQTPDQMPVDVELALMVDASRSMRPDEQALQRRGYAEALRSANVISAIEAGLLGRVALTYMEWSGSNTAKAVVPWTLIETPADAFAFATALEAPLKPSGGRTSVASAIDYGAEAIRTNRFKGARQVIDISGDGPNNAGPLVDASRDKAVADGMIINGLPLMTRDGIGAGWHLDELDLYYAACVIGGPGAFLIPVHEWSDLAAAVRRKIVLELADADAGLPAPFVPANYDCQIGEKLWEEFRRNIDWP